MKLKLGTRKSLLAWAQSTAIARAVERLNPGVTVELFGIETRGDVIQDVPLQSVAGKDFFVAEIDQALRDGVVDLTVHSMKDLSLERPSEFVLGAVPKRENPRDVILFGPSVLDRLKSGLPVRIGTSSPRRLENIPPFLTDVLPRFDEPVVSSAPKVEMLEIRGNVNTRLSRVHEPETSPRKLDGVVLAFAGLIRLWADENARLELARLLNGVRWMVLPLAECAAASAQGALAVECRAKDAHVRAALAKLHDPMTERQATRERALLADFGGGCHQRFGATSIQHAEFGELFFVRGRKPDGSLINELQWNAPAATAHATAPWDGSNFRANADGIEMLSVKPAQSGKPVFIAHARAASEPWTDELRQARVWVSGTASWKKLAARGIWVEGSAENLGFASLAATLTEGVLQLPAAWTVLTHDGAPEGWRQPGFGALELDPIATYRVAARYSNTTIEELRRADHVYWSSASQYDELGRYVSAEARQACGPGKTANILKARGISPTVFPSAEEWRKWLKIANR